MASAHAYHPLGRFETGRRLTLASRHHDEAMGRARGHENKRGNEMETSGRAPKRRGTLQRLWAPTSRELGVFIAHWLISTGLPYNTVATEDFKLLVQRLTGDPEATVLSASTFRDLLEVTFSKFCGMTAALLQREFKAAHGFPFLNLHHDGWTTANGKVGVLGTSVSFIDKAWRYREIALLLTVGNTSHVSADVHKMICSRVRDLYGVDINAMCQFTMSDTTSSAQKVSKLFEDSSPTDCSMHILNLCVQYAMGLRENKQTVDVYEPVTNTWKREQRYCTVGGVFEEGRDLIRRVRALNKYFCNQQRCTRLEKVQEFFSLPTLKTMVDCDTRVGYTVKLFRRTILNYAAFRGYFQKCEKGDDDTVFQSLTAVDWRLMAEMEAVVGSFADLALINVQCTALVASELIVLFKYAADRLNSNTFLMYDLESPRTSSTTVESFPRRPVRSTEFSDLASTCLARMKGQVLQRVATATAENVLILLLDPRTKFSVESLVQPSSSRTKEGEVRAGDALEAQWISEVIQSGNQLLVDAHREVYGALNSSAPDAADLNGAAIDAPDFDLVPAADSNEVICGAPVAMQTPDRSPQATIHEKADQVLEEWLQFAVDWVSVAVQQSADEEKQKEFFTRLLLVRQGGVVCWRVDAVCEHVDITRWFEETGRICFPSIDALARVWLGRAASNALQERVFSTGDIVMSSCRTRTDNLRAEKQVLLKQNRKELQRMEADRDETA